MEYRRKFYALVALAAAAGAPLGFAAGYVEVPERAMLWAALVGVVVVTGGTVLWQRRLRKRGEYDERDRRIELKAAYATLSVVYGGLLVLTVVVLFGEAPVRMDALLLALVIAGVVAFVGGTEWYSRRM